MPSKMAFREFLMTEENAHEQNGLKLCKLYMGKSWEDIYGDIMAYLCTLGL